MKAARQVTVTLKQFAAELAGTHDLPKKVAEAVLGDLVTLAIQHLKQGDKIRLTGLGIATSARATGSNGEGPGDRRVDQDCGQQKGRIPPRQGTEGDRLMRCRGHVRLLARSHLRQAGGRCHRGGAELNR